MSGQDGRYLSVREVSEQLGVAPATVQRWIRNGELKALKFGGRMGYRIESGEVAAFVRRRAVAVAVSNRLAGADEE